MIEGVGQRQQVLVAGGIQCFEENCGETLVDGIRGITLEGLAHLRYGEEYSARGIDGSEQRPGNRFADG